MPGQTEGRRRELRTVRWLASLFTLGLHLGFCATLLLPVLGAGCMSCKLTRKAPLHTKYRALQDSPIPLTFLLAHGSISLLFQASHLSLHFLVVFYGVSSFSIAPILRVGEKPVKESLVD